MNLPNKLTLARLVLVPVLIVTYLFPYTYLGIHMPTFDLLSAHLSLKDILVFVIFAVASFTDFLDGYIARRDNLVTTFGKFVDPIADKLIVNTALLLLASSGRISILVPIIMIARDTIVDAVRLVAVQNNVVIAASILGKAKTVTQMIGIVLVMLNNIVFGYLNIPMDQIMMVVATIISLVSGFEYFIKNKDFIMESM
jgi:CDP-diacylglycerol--glycerol-3-phosphate 3-phosphatidyltransferase